MKGYERKYLLLLLSFVFYKQTVLKSTLTHNNLNALVFKLLSNTW